MKSLTTLAAAAALSLSLSAPASADDSWTDRGSVGPWRMASSDTVCKAMGDHNNGTQVSFAINSHGAAMIILDNPSWNIPKGSYPVVTQIDRTAPQKVKATAEKDYLIFEFYLNETTLNLLSYGRKLSVTVGTQVYEYALTRSEAMLKALTACAAPRIAAGSNPFSGTPSIPASSNPFTGI